MEALQKARMWISFTDKQDEYKALGKEKAELEASRQEKEKCLEPYKNKAVELRSKQEEAEKVLSKLMVSSNSFWRNGSIG